MNYESKYRLFGNTLAVVVSLLMTASSVSSIAQEPQATKQTVALTPKVGKKLQEVQPLVEAKQYAAAENLLRDMQNWPNLPDYDQAQIWNLTAYNYYSQENYQGAINAYERVLGLNIPPALMQSSLKTVAQLYFTVENYPKALERVQDLIRIIDSPSADVLMLLGQAYFQAGRYNEALTPIRQGIDLYSQQGKTPKENWLLLLRVCYYELQDYNGMVRTLQELLRYYPKDQYMLTLAGAYSELGDTKKQLVLTEVLYEGGVINGSQHAVNLANLYLMQEIPYRAAQVLEESMANNVVESTERNLRLLSQAWYQAREDAKSIPPLERAAGMASDGELYVRLAQSQLNLDRWDDAIGSINKAINKGGIKRRDLAYIMLGMAQINKKKWTEALSAFGSARGDSRSTRQIDQWEAFVKNEIKREETMKQTLPDAVKREQDEMLRDQPSSDSGK